MPRIRDVIVPLFGGGTVGNLLGSGSVTGALLVGGIVVGVYAAIGVVMRRRRDRGGDE